VHRHRGLESQILGQKFGRPGVTEVTSRPGTTIRNGARAEIDWSGNASASAASGLVGALECRTAKIDMATRLLGHTPRRPPAWCSHPTALALLKGIEKAADVGRGVGLQGDRDAAYGDRYRLSQQKFLHPRSSPPR
jgi:hypothetical protein